MNQSTYDGVDHIGIVVHDAESALTTYCDVLGFQSTHHEILTERGIRVDFLETGNAQLELLSPLHESSEISSFLLKKGPGLHHIAIKVANIHETVQRIEAKGGKVIGSGIQNGAHNTLVAFIHPKTTGGILLELVEYPAVKETGKSL